MVLFHTLGQTWIIWVFEIKSFENIKDMSVSANFELAFKLGGWKSENAKQLYVCSGPGLHFDFLIIIVKELKQEYKYLLK